MTELLNNQGWDKERVNLPRKIRIRQVYPEDNERLAVLLKCTSNAHIGRDVGA